MVLDGHDRLFARGHFIQPASAVELVEEMGDLGSVIRVFIRDKCELGATLTVECDRLFMGWRLWCQQNGRRHAGTAQTFGRSLRAVLPKLRTRHPANGRVYVGIALL
jgi:putative DNA primase/helicase